jgi:hypothetical protein
VRLDEIYRELKDRMRFLAVYVREAHPADGWVSQNNVEVGICFNLPKTPDDRAAIARELIEKMDFSIPLALDDMENGIAELYGALPNRLVVVDGDGIVRYPGAVGPHGFDPEAWRAAILEAIDQGA